MQAMSYATTLAIERDDLLKKLMGKLQVDFFKYFKPAGIPPAQEDALLNVFVTMQGVMDRDEELTAEDVQQGLDNIKLLQDYIELKMKDDRLREL